MRQSEHIQSALSYGIGFTAMSLPQILEGATSLFTCLAAFGGFVLVCLRVRYEWKRRNK
jgi:hypothetical protein